MLTQDLLRELFDYNPETGELSRKDGTLLSKRPVTKDKYKQVRINRSPHRVHRIVWLWMYGEIPKGMFIDHINGNKHDNRIANLRLATQKQNNQNKLPTRKGYKGISKKRNKWAAYISENNKTICLGVFNTPEEAARAYDAAAIERFGTFAKTNAALGLL